MRGRPTRDESAPFHETGLERPRASFLIACIMAVAAGMVRIPAGHPLVAAKGGPSYGPALGYLASAMALLLRDPGRLSLDGALFGRATHGKTADVEAI